MAATTLLKKSLYMIEWIPQLILQEKLVKLKKMNGWSLLLSLNKMTH